MTAMHSKKDAIIALAYFAYFILRDFAVSLSYSHFSGGSGQILEDWHLIIAITCVIDILIVVAIVKFRKQSLASIGLHKQKLLSAIGLGLLFAPIFLFSRVVPGITGGWILNALGSFLFALANVMLWAVREYISFVGFIQTRLYGLVKNDAWAINLGAVLFALAHIPSRLVGGIPLWDITFMLLLVNWFFMHRAFVMLFKKYHSLVPVFIMHVASNFPGLWQGEGRISPMLTVMIPTVVFCVTVEIWYYQTERKNNLCSNSTHTNSNGSP
ncbi:MAG: hypothetical protein FWD06_03190 [Oscillospiraceae bacterium]|nr:hypothetical protein [Oscillospiraceae bacterium]